MALHTWSGSMRNRLTVRRDTTSADAQGGQVVVTTDLGTVSVELVDLSGREALQAGALQSSVTSRARLWFEVGQRLGITVQDKAWKEPIGPLYEVTAVRDPDGRSVWLELDLTVV